MERRRLEAVSCPGVLMALLRHSPQLWSSLPSAAQIVPFPKGETCTAGPWAPIIKPSGVVALLQALLCRRSISAHLHSHP